MDYRGDNSYRIIQSQSLNSEMLISLAVLYSPLIGSKALALYHLLASEANRRNINMRLNRLCKLLNISIDELTENIQVLEQFKLLRSFYNSKSNNCRFDLQAPLSPRKFLQHDVFSRLYAKAIGNEQFDITSQLHGYIVENEDADLEVTSNFDFNFFNERWSIDDEYSYNNVNKAKYSKVIPNFDLADFKRKMSNILMPQSLRTDDNFEIIAQMATIFNIDVDTMRTLVTDSIDPDTNTFDTELLRQKCINTKKQARYDSSVGYTLQPVQFLSNLQEGLPVTSADKKTLEYLQLDLNLPKEVINYLVEYVYNHNNHIIGKNYIEKVATSWSSKGVKTIEEAKQLLETKPTKNKTKMKDFVNINATESSNQDYDEVINQLFKSEEEA